MYTKLGYPISAVNRSIFASEEEGTVCLRQYECAFEGGLSGRMSLLRQFLLCKKACTWDMKCFRDIARRPNILGYVRECPSIHLMRSTFCEERVVLCQEKSNAELRGHFCIGVDKSMVAIEWRPLPVSGAVFSARGSDKNAARGFLRTDFCWVDHCCINSFNALPSPSGRQGFLGAGHRREGGRLSVCAASAL